MSQSANGQELLNATSMRALFLFLLLLLFFLVLPETSHGQGNLTLSTTPIEVSGLDSVTLQIPADLDTFQYTDITFFLEGGDGGRAVRDGRTGRGGDGAQVSVSFPLGNGSEALRPGGLIRFVVGGRGENATGTDTNGGAGGGGGTAILYKDPGVSNSGGTRPTTRLANSMNHGWTLLAVAGGGGGGYVSAGSRSNGRPGTSIRAGSEGRSVDNDPLYAGGTGGSAGEDVNNGGGAGCGFNTISGAGDNRFNGRAGGITGQKGDDFANRSGGFGYSPGGHGRRSRGAGGGGGFSGGGAGQFTGGGGGGGGSFASSASTATTIIERDDNNSADNGFITYTFTEDPTPGPSPDAFCKDQITVTIDGNSETIITGLELDNGSTNPLNAPLNYLIALNGVGDNFTIFDEITFDCDNIRINNDWYLAVANVSDTTICATQTTIIGELGATFAPTCPNDRTVDLDDGCIGTIPFQNYRLVNSGDCSDPAVMLVLPNLEVVNDPPGFLQSGYEFVAGTTTVTYTNSVGSCSFTLTINAGEVLNLGCPNDRTFNASNNQCGREISDNITELTNDGVGVSWQLTNTDILDFEPITGTGNLPDDYYFDRGVTRVEYFFEDAGGCVSNCSFEITIEGDEEDRPNLQCVDQLTLEYSPDMNLIDSLDQAIISLTDDCGIQLITYPFLPDLDCNDIGRNNQVQIRVLDVDGDFNNGDYDRGDCSFNVFLTETTPPVARCKETLVLNLGGQGRVSIFGDQLNDGTTADCGVFLDIAERPSNTNLSLNCNNLGENLVTMIAIHNEGDNLRDSCTTTVIVQDNRPPTPLCQNITLILSENGDAFLAPVSLDGGSTDNCTITDYAASKTAFNCDDIGPNTVQLNLTDQSGNASSCTSTVTIQDSPNAYCATILPVELSSFTGLSLDKTNQLNWTVALEDAFSHYEVERSVDGATGWQFLGAVAGAENGQGSDVTSPLSPGEGPGERSYTFTDATPFTDNYYRLKMVDLDGSFSYSPIVQLEGPIQAELRVFPNPADGQFTAALPQVDGPLNLALYSVHGTRVRAQKVAPGTTTLTVEDGLRPGVYLLVVEANGERWTERVVVQ